MRLFTLVLTACAALIAVVTGCSNDSTGPGSGTVTPPFELTHPDSLILSLECAIEDMDSELYGYLLFDGGELMRNGESYAPFTFYFVEDAVDMWGDPLVSAWEFDAEMACMENLLSGEPGLNDIPGVRDVDIGLLTANDWLAPVDPDSVEGDPYPAGTLTCRYYMDALIVLKGTVPGTDVIAFVINDSQRFYAVPVLLGEGDAARTEYRLWKWRDLGWGYRATEDTSWSSVKAIWREVEQG